MPEIFLKKHKGLVHIGFENISGNVTSLFSIHVDTVADLIDFGAYDSVRRGKTIAVELVKSRECGDIVWED